MLSEEGLNVCEFRRLFLVYVSSGGFTKNRFNQQFLFQILSVLRIKRNYKEKSWIIKSTDNGVSVYSPFSFYTQHLYHYFRNQWLYYTFVDCG